MTIRIEFSTESDAFAPGAQDVQAVEIARALRQIGSDIMGGRWHGRVLDTNGNDVGFYYHYTDERMVADLKDVWQGIGPDVLMSIEQHEYKDEETATLTAEDVRSIVGDSASMHLRAPYDKVFQMAEWRDRNDWLKAAFPDGELYGW